MYKRIVMILIIIFLLFTSCSTENMDYQNIHKEKIIVEVENVENIRELYITVLPNTYTLEELNHDTNYRDDEVVEVKVLVQEGNGGETKLGDFGYGLTDANGMMKLRGHSTRKSEQKSYKIKLNKKGGLWDGNEIINFNKHPFDTIRIRNKLSYDLLSIIPNTIRVKTQFVHVYIKDYSEGDYTQEYQDYGLFTQVENVDTDFLKNNQLDKKGHLYKAENFEFYRYLEAIKLKNDKNFDEELFESVLESKGSDDHEKLIRMLEDVNNEYKHINEVIEEHFDRDNYMTWLALNLLLGNADTNSQNFFLYSPRQNNKWYFIPWDFDGAWGYYNQMGIDKGLIGSWQQGVSNYWGVVLHRRFLKNKDNVEALSQKVEELSEILTEENINTLLTHYKPVVLGFLSRQPDKEEEWTLEDLEGEFNRLPGLVEKNKEIYYQSLQNPMPVFMADPYNLGDYYVFKWTASYDFQGDMITYNIDISSSPDFETIAYHKEGIVDTEFIIETKNLKPGIYYWRVGIKDAKGNEQIAFDEYIDESRKHFFGIREFLVN